MKKVLLILLYLGVFSASAQLVSYPVAEHINSENKFAFPSPHYKVSLIQGDHIIEDFVYCMNSMHTTNNSKTTSWVNFSFEGKVTVRVKHLRKEIDFAQILPASKGIETKIIDQNTIEFELEHTGHYSVEFEDDLLIEHPLLIFANPLEKDIPSPEDENVIYFGKGLHEIGDEYVIPKGKTVYLEGGAYVKGQFVSEGSHEVTIRGRGIMSGEDYAPRTHHHMIELKNANKIEIEGITMIHSPRFMVVLRGKDHYIHNVKMMGWWFSTDGISAGQNTLIEDCFFKVNDDAVKLYQSSTTVRRCTIWQLENGAPFMISWNGSKDFGNCKVSDIDIIRVEHHWDNENLAVICAIHGGKANISDFEFDNIRIDNSKWRIFHLVTRPNRWGKWNPEKGSLSNFTFKNFYYHGKPQIENLIMGHDRFHPIRNIQFENIVIDGQQLKHLDRKHFIIHPEFTCNITLK